MPYNRLKAFAVARLREAARDCGVRKKLLKLRATASRTKVAEVAEACAARPDRFAAGKERARKAYEDFLAAAQRRGRPGRPPAAAGNEAGAGGEEAGAGGEEAGAAGEEAGAEESFVSSLPSKRVAFFRVRPLAPGSVQLYHGRLPNPDFLAAASDVLPAACQHLAAACRQAGPAWRG